VAEDWRVTVDVGDASSARGLVRELHATEVEAEAQRALGTRLAVSADHGHVFLYADTEAAARLGAETVRQILEQLDLAGWYTLERWHPEAEAWEGAEVPLPSTDAEREEEHERLRARDIVDSESTGIAEWEVRVELGSHGDAHAFADRLESEGYRVVRRWTYVLVGVDDEETATALADQLRAEAPAGATVEVAPGSGLVWQVVPGNPFAVFGGLAG
jgi:hypothetical protein